MGARVMPFLKAGFNARHRRTGIKGWTRHVDGKRFEPAELIVFECGDFAWLGIGERFLAWSEKVVLGTRLDLPWDWPSDEELASSKLPVHGTRPVPAAVKLVLPYPVSANRYWRTFIPKGQHRPLTLVSEDAKAYKEEIGWLAKAAGVRAPIPGVVELRIRLVPDSGVCMDLDNCLKVSIDALKGIVFGDDSQVYRITAERTDPVAKGGKRLEVEVLPYALPMALEAAA